MTTAIVNGYCTLAALKAEKGISTSDTTDDENLSIAINAASRQIDNYCGQRFWIDSVVQTRTYRPTSSDFLDLLDTDDGAGIATTTGLLVKLDSADSGTYSTSLTSGTDFYLEPLNAATRTPVWPYTSIRLSGLNYWFNRSAYGRATVQITAKFGWPAIPDDVSNACLRQAAFLAKGKDATLGGIELGATGVPLFVKSRLHPMAEALLSPYQRPAVG